GLDRMAAPRARCRARFCRVESSPSIHTRGFMDGVDSTAAPRFRLRCQRQPSITFIQARQQIRQTRFHRPERVIIPDRHIANSSTWLIPSAEMTRDTKKFTRSRLVIYLQLPSDLQGTVLRAGAMCGCGI